MQRESCLVLLLPLTKAIRHEPDETKRSISCSHQEERAKREEELEERASALEAVVESLRQDLEVGGMSWDVLIGLRWLGSDSWVFLRVRQFFVLYRRNCHSLSDLHTHCGHNVLGGGTSTVSSLGGVTETVSRARKHQPPNV